MAAASGRKDSVGRKAPGLITSSASCGCGCCGCRVSSLPGAGAAGAAAGAAGVDGVVWPNACAWAWGLAPVADGSEVGAWPSRGAEGGGRESAGTAEHLGKALGGRRKSRGARQWISRPVDKRPVARVAGAGTPRPATPASPNSPSTPMAGPALTDDEVVEEGEGRPVFGACAGSGCLV